MVAKRVDITREFLLEEYVKNGKNMHEISIQKNCSLALISKKIKEYDLKEDIGNKYIGKDKKFGKLKPLAVTGWDRHSHVKLLCECECGKCIEVSAYSLTTHNTKSCGCSKTKKGKEHPLYTGYELIAGRVWATLIRGAKERGFPFNITIKEAWEKFLAQDRKCALTGTLLIFSEKTNEQIKTTASLDRIDSSKGYLLDNIQWVHKKINIMKSNMSQEEFINWCLLVTQNNKEVQ